MVKCKCNSSKILWFLMILLLLSSIVLFSWKPPIVEGNTTDTCETTTDNIEKLRCRRTEFIELDEKLTDYLNRSKLVSEKDTNNIDEVIQNRNDEYVKSRESVIGLAGSGLSGLLDGSSLSGTGEFVKFASLLDYQLKGIEESISKIDEQAQKM